jgi:hypothetical protein
MKSEGGKALMQQARRGDNDATGEDKLSSAVGAEQKIGAASAFGSNPGKREQKIVAVSADEKTPRGKRA